MNYAFQVFILKKEKKSCYFYAQSRNSFSAPQSHMNFAFNLQQYSNYDFGLN